MASSQVEIASNSAFSYVLKERNRCSNSFQKNFKDLVSSCISGHSRNSGQGFIDYADLWVHNPQTGGNENEGSGNNNPKMSGHSDGNENSDDFKDLWVHNPQRNDTKKTTAGEKWDAARNIAFLPERKKQESSESPKSHSFSKAVPIPNPHKSSRLQEGAAAALDRDASASAPVADTSQRANNWEVVSSKLLPRKIEHSRNSPNHSESARGVSSLVRKWRDFEAESKSPVCTSTKSLSVLCLGDNEPLGDCCDESVDLRPLTPTKNEDLFFDWESDQTGSCKGRDSDSCKGRDSDATEKEKIRVADIIKKLTSNGESHTERVSSVSHDSGLPRVRTSVDKSEVRPFSPVASSPRLRGRQAFADLLMQMERDRQNELEGLANQKPVSRFSHRGRIQATLRVRFLRRGAEGKDGRPPIPTPSECTKNAQSAVLHMRQKFRETNSKSQQKEDVVTKSSHQEEKVSSVSQQTKENHQKGLSEPTKPLNDIVEKKLGAQKAVRNPVDGFNQQEGNTMEQPNDRQQHESQTCRQEETSASEVIQQETKSESCHHEELEVSMKETSVKNITVAEDMKSEESNNQKLMESNNEFPRMTDEAQVVVIEHEEDHHSFVVCDYGHETDSLGGEWEEEEDDQSEEPNQDWICDVSRPRSAWEDLRQARYQEMLDPFMEKGDIKDLLNRRSVSSFLSSSLRENIDRLMMSRAVESPKRSVCRVPQEERRDQVEQARSLEMQEEEENFEHVHEGEDKNQIKGYEYEKYKEDEIHSNHECMESRYPVQETSWENRQDHNFAQFHKEEDKNQRKGYEYEKYNEDEIHSNHECMESRYPAQETPWENSQDHYFASSSFPSPRESHAFDFSSPDTQPSSTFTNHPSIEMQFMYEMRGNMEQLHQEITKLRRSVKSCISMQTKLQKVIGQEAKSSSCHSGRKKRKDSSVSKKSSRGRCCICYEMQIDSLLYRCGHMCTCFKCAKDLQWSSGKCPICEAQIIDVVRAYAYS